MSVRPPNPIGPLVRASSALNSKHVDAFYPLISGEENAHLWDYMFEGPFHELADFRATMKWKTADNNCIFYAVVPNDEDGHRQSDDKITGIVSFLRIEPTQRCLEIGNVMYSPQLQRTRAATEVIQLLAHHAFDGLGYRRCEWKCNALNAPSRRAALRLGFAFEGIFRKHMIVKGRSRDTAWYAMTDDDWLRANNVMTAWLEPGNFDGDGVQIKRLEDIRISSEGTPW
ncbi:putative acetyltransferase, GNAT family [Xylariomycetidae sp. FL0641]|nr:putative acetyltransferase, GNAT family [Xylariomycetidae sp. FL0641]